MAPDEEARTSAEQQQEEQELLNEALGAFTDLLTMPQGKAWWVLERTGWGPKPDEDRSPSLVPLYELASLELEVERKAKKFRRLTTMWAVSALTLALVSAVLAAVSGIAGLADTVGKATAGYIAIASAAAGAVSAILQGTKNLEERTALAAAWQALADDITDAVTTIASDERLKEDPSPIRRKALEALKRARERQRELMPGVTRQSPRSGEIQGRRVRA